MGGISCLHLPSWLTSSSYTIAFWPSCQDPVSHPVSNQWFHSCRGLLGLLGYWWLLSCSLHSCSDLSTSMILLLYSFLILTFILFCWTPSPSSIPRYLYVSAWSRSGITWFSFSGIPSAATFLPLLNDAFAHLSNPNSTLISSDTFFTVLISPVS